MELFQSTIAQLKKTKVTKVENALMWIYLKTWGVQAQHAIDMDRLNSWVKINFYVNFKVCSPSQDLMDLSENKKILEFNLDMDELWNFGGEDFQEAMMGIVFPPRKESKEGAEEDLVESLRKLIMGKFDDSKDDFYKWSQTIHDEVRYIHIIWIKVFIDPQTALSLAGLYEVDILKIKVAEISLDYENDSNESCDKSDGVY